MSTILAAIIVAAAVAWGAFQIATEIVAAREEDRRTRTLSIAALFAPALGAVQGDPKALLVWQPLATAIRKLFPDECARLDASAGGPFPFSADVIESAHARWTTEWLAWEQTHDATYKM